MRNPLLLAAVALLLTHSVAAQEHIFMTGTDETRLVRGVVDTVETDTYLVRSRAGTVLVVNDYLSIRTPDSYPGVVRARCKPRVVDTCRSVAPGELVEGSILVDGPTAWNTLERCSQR